MIGHAKEWVHLAKESTTDLINPNQCISESRENRILSTWSRGVASLADERGVSIFRRDVELVSGITFYREEANTEKKGDNIQNIVMHNQHVKHGMA